MVILPPRTGSYAAPQMQTADCDCEDCRQSSSGDETLTATGHSCCQSPKGDQNAYSHWTQLPPVLLRWWDAYGHWMQQLPVPDRWRDAYGHWTQLLPVSQRWPECLWPLDTASAGPRWDTRWLQTQTSAVSVPVQSSKCQDLDTITAPTTDSPKWEKTRCSLLLVDAVLPPSDKQSFLVTVSEKNTTISPENCSTTILPPKRFIKGLNT